jgi:hypothetical protein
MPNAKVMGAMGDIVQGTQYSVQGEKYGNNLLPT